MPIRSSRTLMTIGAALALLGVLLAVVGLLAVDVLAVLILPFVALTFVRLAQVLHWTLFAACMLTTAAMLIRVEASDSSTAGFGLVVVPLLLTTGIVVVALVDRMVRSPTRSLGPN